MQRRLSGSYSYAYDNNDALLTQADRFTIARNEDNGFAQSVTGGNMSLTRTFNGFGETDGENFSVSGQSVAEWDLTRNNLGKITPKTLTHNNTSATFP